MTTDSYRRLIAIDFDGVLHSYTSPWTDAATISDPPTPGAMAFLRTLVDDDRFSICIVSSRCSQGGGSDAIRAWLERHLADLHDEDSVEVFGLDVLPGTRVMIERTPFSRRDVARILRAIPVVDHRPPAFVTIDDRAWTFDGTWPDLDVVAAFKPWNKRPTVALPTGEQVQALMDSVVLDGRPLQYVDLRADPESSDLNAELLRVLVGPDASDPAFTWLKAMVDGIELLEGAGKRAWEGDDPVSAGECLSECRRIVDSLRDILRPHLDQLAADAEGRAA